MPLSISPDQLAAAGGYIAREWGDHGYTIEGIESPTHMVSVFHVRYSDGSRFTVLVDRWGNCFYADTNEITDSESRAAYLDSTVHEMHVKATAR